MGGSDSKEESPPPSPPPEEDRPNTPDDPNPRPVNANKKKGYTELKKELLKNGQLFEDPDFPANYTILSNTYRNDRNIKWMRPSDILGRKSPKFIVDGASRSDLNQAALGDCWFISGAVCLITYNKGLFARVVPEDQTFSEGDYAGIFHFYFWQFGKFVEVVIDDLLPTKWGQIIYAKNRTEEREFWPALLEKAYAKLYGGYESLDGGFLSDACVDLTGGISERIQLDKSSRAKDLFDVLKETARMNSMMGLSIAGKGTEEELPNGLFKAHAYSITGLATVNYLGSDVDLVRVRNPWGKGEWNMSWSDSSAEWKHVSEEDKQVLGLLPKEDGEFWMSYTDVYQNFEDLELCHLYPDAHTKETAVDTKKMEWKVLKFHGEWVSGLSAGGCGNAPDQELYWQNPQYKIVIKERTTVIISLLIKGSDMGRGISVNYHMLQMDKDAKRLPEGVPDFMHINTVRNRALGPGMYLNIRERSGRHVVEAGTYVVIPSTFYPNQAGRFMLRVYTDTGELSGGEIDEPTVPITPTREKDTADDLFMKHAGSDSKMYAHELQSAVDDFCLQEYNVQESIGYERARSLLAMMDSYRIGYIMRTQFRDVLKNIQQWQLVFAAADKNRSGKLDTYELSKSLKNAGYQVSTSVRASMVRRYGGRQHNINLQDFILMLAKLRTYHELYQRYVQANAFTLTLEEWLSITMSF